MKVLQPVNRLFIDILTSAIQSGCQAFLTNDLQLKRVNELSILVVRELTL